MRRIWLLAVLLLGLAACGEDGGAVFGGTTGPGETTIPAETTVPGEATVAPTTATPGATTASTTTVAALALDPNAPANYSAEGVETWQSADNDGRQWVGWSLPMSVGGPVDVGYLGWQGCTGWATVAPDAEVTLTADGEGLDVFFGCDSGSVDAALVVNLPDGTWVCNDGFSAGLFSEVELGSGAAGTYRIWVAARSEGAAVAGTLSVSTSPAP